MPFFIFYQAVNIAEYYTLFASIGSSRNFSLALYMVRLAVGDEASQTECAEMRDRNGTTERSTVDSS